ncbi:MAG: carbohydrate kinase family protein [Chloroflexota bacterium]|nr:carbohydrate kinase family protein [Chloroflexota bacterium]
MRTKNIITAGHICLDIRPDRSPVPTGEGSRLLQPGAIEKANGLTFMAGGSVANTGLALRRLGSPVRLIGKVGADTAGHLVAERLAGHDPQLAEDLVVDPAMPTGLRVITDSSDASHPILQTPGANNTFYASDLARTKLEQADLLHFGYPALMRSIYRGGGGELVSILQRARKSGLTTSLDAGLPDPNSPAAEIDWPDLLANCLPYLDLFLTDVQDLLFLLQRETYDTLSADPAVTIEEAVTTEMLDALTETVLGYGVKVLLIRLGRRGVTLRTGANEAWRWGGRGLEDVDATWYDRTLWSPAFEAEPAVSQGMGDAINAGFLAGLLNGAAPEATLRAAAGTAASAEIPTWTDLTIKIEQGWQTLPLDLRAQGWRKDMNNGIWQKD